MSRIVRARTIAGAVLACLFAVALAAHADEASRRAAVIAKVGDRAVTVGELEDRLAALPRFQLLELGKTPEEIRKRFLESVVMPEALLEAAGARREVGKSRGVQDRLARARANATLRAIARRIPSVDRIPAEEVKAYYDAHLAQFDAPERIAIWRVLVSTREDAAAVLAAAKKDLTVPAFTALAREKSIDKATHLRAGNVGFVGADGVSNEAGLKIDPAVVAAAKTVKDGELVPSPVAEGSAFAVVWRRGTVAAEKRTLAEVDEQIRAILVRRKADDATQKLLDELGKAHAGPIDTELLRTIDLPTFLDLTPHPVGSGGGAK